MTPVTIIGAISYRVSLPGDHGFALVFITERRAPNGEVSWLVRPNEDDAHGMNGWIFTSWEEAQGKARELAEVVLSARHCRSLSHAAKEAVFTWSPS